MIICYFSGLENQDYLIKIYQIKKKNFKSNLINLLELKKFTQEFTFEILKKKPDLKKIGLILDKSWKLKKSFSPSISDKYLDKIYNKALSAGCYGGKLLGAGGGGFYLFVCLKKFHKKVQSKIKGCKKIEFRFENEGTVSKFIN